MSRRIGDLERQILTYAQLLGLGELPTEDLKDSLKPSAKQERELCSRMTRWDDGEPHDC